MFLVKNIAAMIVYLSWNEVFLHEKLGFFSPAHRKRAIPRNLGNFFTDIHNNQHGGQRAGRSSSSSFYILLTSLLLR